MYVRGTTLWKFIPYTICWVLWNERYAKTFEGVSSSVEKLVVQVKETVWNWSSESPIMKTLTLEGAIYCWDLILYGY